MCPPFVSLLVSALFRWPCSVSIHLSPKAVTAGVDTAAQSWETNLKDCKAEADTAAQS